MKITNLSKVLIVIYVIAIILWISFIFLSGYKSTLQGPIYYYVLIPFLVCETILPLIGGFIGIYNSAKWGGWKSFLGRSSLGIGLGLLAWSGGMIIWNYYLFFTNISVPYPSIADAIFILSWPLWSYGLIQMSRVVGVNFEIKNKDSRYFFLLIPIVIIIFSIYLLFGVARNWGMTFDESFVKLFFDLFYPIGDIVILTMTALVYFGSRKLLGGLYKMPIIILFCGFVLNYCADFLFSLTTTQGTYFNGHLSDFLFTTAMFVLGFGLAQLTPSILSAKQSASTK